MVDMDEQYDYEVDSAGEKAAQQTALSMAGQRVQERHENPQFTEQLVNPDVDSDEYDWIEKDLGPLFSRTHVFANRDEEYEREAKWTNRAKADRVIAEGDPGRIAKNWTVQVGGETFRPILELSQGVADRPDKDLTVPYTSDERRALLDAMEASTAHKTLGIENTGLSSLTEATAVTKRETSEEESKTTSERTASLFD